MQSSLNSAKKNKQGGASCRRVRGSSMATCRELVSVGLLNRRVQQGRGAAGIPRLSFDHRRSLHDRTQFVRFPDLLTDAAEITRAGSTRCAASLWIFRRFRLFLFASSSPAQMESGLFKMMARVPPFFRACIWIFLTWDAFLVGRLVSSRPRTFLQVRPQ